MGSLLNSRWAPNTNQPNERYQPRHTFTNIHNVHNHRTRSSSPAFRPPPYQPPSHQQGTLLPPAEELSRFMKIVARLRWKLPFLAEGYRLATLTDAVEPGEIVHAEIMFKIDFHEYYALLERAIVHLLAVFNISVSAGRGGGVSVDGNGRGGSVHRYHANVLEALREQSTPLSPVLGAGVVYSQLQRAKELRNRWKTADLTAEERERQGERKEVVALASFDFEGILSDIFLGLEESYVRAKDHVDKCIRPDDGPGVEVDEEAGWGFMVDAMDWEAV
ncbi:hypothetical protein N7499_004506 [Penicillium canescens]|uniref:Uncharacterized protein n=1 Tax=Penicillium canescens TaxID=5083 RepID=A0AAD6N7C2_PENCN|nr:uncharacterized protein N7446_005144 [Penicillium canescens]KAJ6010090.1 hypothetical protein N7522_005106 [Penicillium canescens]KAJ6038341.1 hypothetical protein N7460_008112 [Penicillium canescens]KAJ6039542.1 hypothetical protein N7444_008447 [Penicillium canescens]KAJ6068107.1 hypothetical protein N7446_005144 [Penicillium canescens]KAJ6084877.1 hypothetical protein N7499_004506 [Penicillium canescens]